MVFKRITDRIVSVGTTAADAVNGAVGQINNLMNTVDISERAEKVSRLKAMGFPQERAEHALNATEGDVDRAAELLLLSQDEGATVSTPPSTVRDRDIDGQHLIAHNDEQMRLVIEESRRLNHEEEARMLREAEVASMGKAKGLDHVGSSGARAPAKKAQPRTAAAINAGKAAADRFNKQPAIYGLATSKRTLNDTHPNVKVPAQMKDKSKEEQIIRCADRLKSHVTAIETLIRALNMVRKSPESEKFRTIDRSNANYKKFVIGKPGAEDMLAAVNYRRVPNRNELRLERHLVDDALLYLAVSALEQTRSSPEYIEAKLWRSFHTDMRRIGKASLTSNEMTEEEAATRVAYMSKCPNEPAEGRGAWMYVHLGDEKEAIEGGKICRRFDGDDTLDDILHWIGGYYGKELLERIFSREWCLCDLNRYPILPMDIEKHSKNTLQYLGCFPSGRLGVRPSTDLWREGKSKEIVNGLDNMGSTRGLGAASRSMLLR